MTIWDWLGHLTFVLIAVSYLVRDMLLLRLLSIVASVAGILYYLYVPAGPLWLVINWNLAFLAVNLLQVLRIIYDRREISFSEEQKELYETVFNHFSPIEFLKMMRLSEWRTAEKGEVLARQDVYLEQMMLIYSGQAEVEIDNQLINRLKDGDFIGEMSFLSAKNATATVTATDTTRYLCWQKSDLGRMLQRNPNIRFALQAVIGQDLTRKLQRQTQ